MARILIVDDDKDLRLVLATELPGHSLTICAEGFEALTEVIKSYEQNAPFDLMVFDGICPNIDGFTLTKIVRLIEKLGMVHRAMIALMSAYGTMVDQTDAVKESGADLYWRKPEDLLTLRDFVKEHFENG